MPDFPGRKLSGAQSRKRKKIAEQEAKKSSILFKNFFKKAKSHESESEDGDHLNVHVTNKSVEPLQGDSTWYEESNNNQSVATADLNHDVASKQSEHVNQESSNLFELQHTPDDENNLVDVPQDVAPLPAVLLFHDVAYLEFHLETQLSVVSQSLRIEMISRGSIFFQNKDSTLAVPGRRSITRSWFMRRLANGDEVNRSWLLYSPSNEAAYCFCCLLFTSSSTNCRSSFELASGYSKWRKPEKLIAHENGTSHRKSFTTWKETERRIIAGKTIDADIQFQIQKEKQRWRDVLKRILDCIKYLASQNLALRGGKESLTAEVGMNVGNFISLLKLIAEYDPLLASHLKNAKESPGSVSYLSPEIQNEFISLLASNVRNKLLENIKRNKYYGILLDSTPDLGHREQLSEVIRYVDINYEKKTVDIKESFLGYIEIHAKDAATLETVIVEKLKSDNIPLDDCRSQCYDNAAVMTGHISGLQQRIYDRNHRALFVNCDNHSLNLAGVHSARQDPLVITFFGTVESIYLFFSRSTLRWEQLKNAIPITVKRESETRWSARVEAVNAIYEGLDELVGLLEKLSDDVVATHETRSDADRLLVNILNFNFIALLYFWHTILRKIDRVQKRLQDPTMNIKDAASDLESLEINLSEIRHDLCLHSIENSKTRCKKWGIEIEKRTRRRRRMFGELEQDAGLLAEEELMRVMKSVLDRLQQEMSTRFSRLKDINLKFGFLLDGKTFFNDNGEDVNSLRQHCRDLGNFYVTDIDGGELYSEICDCKMLLRSRDVLPAKPLNLLAFIISYGDDVFPNLRIALQILLTIAVSIASCERSFSKLKLILSYLRASMGQDRLSDLALLSIERNELEKCDFNEIIDEFATVKSRKLNLQ